MTVVIIGAVDWSPAPAFTPNAGNAAARAASAKIRFLGLADIKTLECTTGALATAAPWTVICALAGAMGGVGTQAARLVETSRVQTVAETIRTHSVGGATDAALANNLRANVLRARLPKVFRSHNVSSEELSEELTDGFAYKLSDANRVMVEQKRIDLLPHW